MRSAYNSIHRVTLLAAFTSLFSLTGCDPALPKIPGDPDDPDDSMIPDEPDDSDTSQPPATPKVPDAALEERKSNLPRTPVDEPPAAVRANMSKEQLDLGLDLLRHVAAKEGVDANISVSPYSLQAALAMLMPLAQGNTLSELSRVLGGDASTQQVLDGMSYFDQELRLRNTKGGEPSDRVSLSSASRIFIQSGLEPTQKALDALAQNFGAGLFVTDFAKDAPRSLKAINGWVKTSTRGLIPELFTDQDIDHQTQWVLTNALSLRAPWSIRFPEETPASFTLLDGTNIEVPSLWSEEQIGSYGESDTVAWVELPFLGDKISLMLLSPKDGDFMQLQDVLSADLVGKLHERASHGAVEVSLPVFSIDTSLGELAPLLQRRGLRDIFSHKSDLGKLLGDQSEVALNPLRALGQKVRLEINRDGIEAAAATGGPSGGADESPKIEFKLHLDRPFLFIVRDVPTGQTLFSGRVVDPRT